MKKRLLSITLILLSLFLFAWPSYISAIVYRSCEEVDGCKACYYSKEIEFFPFACFVQQPCQTMVNVERSNAKMEVIRCLCQKSPSNDRAIMELFNQSHVGQIYSDADKVTPDLLCSKTESFMFYYTVYQ